jgi:hypothetical protein
MILSIKDPRLARCPSQRKHYKAQLTELTQVQREIAYGMLLGDAHIEKRGHSARMHFRHGPRQEAFIQHLFEVFRSWTWMTGIHVTEQTDGRSGTSMINQQIHFKTFQHPVFLELHQRFYVASATGQATGQATGHRKVIPEAITAWLTPRVLAYQIMCDGYIQDRSLRLATHDFSFGGVCDLRDGPQRALWPPRGGAPSSPAAGES